MWGGRDAQGAPWAAWYWIDSGRWQQRTADQLTLHSLHPAGSSALARIYPPLLSKTDPDILA
jgi:hypothetical protein